VKPKPKGEAMTQLNKVNVTYHAPEGDSKVVEMLKTTFFDGTPVDVICTKDQYEQLQNNPHFKVNSTTEHDPAKEAEHKSDPKAEHKTEHKR
jgi:hypothetical protein